MVLNSKFSCCFRLTSPLSLLTLFFVLPASSQQRWEKNYGGVDNDWGNSVQQTSDGGIIVAGATSSFGNSCQVYLIKVNASGDTLWTRTYGGASDDVGSSVQQTSDGGFVVAGYTLSFGNAYQVYLVKTNASGDTLWTRTFGGMFIDYAFSVQQTLDMGYIVGGVRDESKVYLIKTNMTGDTLWTRTYGGTGIEFGEFARQTMDTGYIVTGWTTSFGNSYQVYLVKTNASGDTLWTKNYGGAGEDAGESVQQTSDGGYIVVGTTGSFGYGYQAYLVKTNASGDTLWTRAYGGAGNEYGRSVQQTADGGYIIAGETSSLGNRSQVFLIKANASGDTIWTRDFGGADQDEGNAVRQTSDGGYIIGGHSYSFGNGEQVYLIKTDANGNVGVHGSPSHQSPVTSYRIFPNPFTSFASIPGHASEHFTLYDISGRLVGTYKGGRIGWDVSPGVYFLRPDTRNPHPDSRILRIVKVR